VNRDRWELLPLHPESVFTSQTLQLCSFTDVSPQSQHNNTILWTHKHALLWYEHQKRSL